MITASTTVTLKEGLSAEITYTGIYCEPRDIDGGWGGTTEESYVEKFEVTIFKDGRKVGSSSLNNFFNPQKVNIKSLNFDSSANLATLYFNTDQGQRRMAVSNSMVSFEELLDIANSLAKENRSPEIQRLVDRKEENRRAERKEDAEMILACDRVFQTEEERHQWVNEYNDLHNEGGEGYIPMTVTQEQVNWAKKVLEEA